MMITVVVNVSLIRYVPTPQNSETYSNNSSAAGDELSVFDHFVGLVLKGLTLPSKLLLVGNKTVIKSGNKL